MQKILVFIIAAFIAYGCASSKKVVDVSIGTWDYVVKGTPDGDLEGNLIIANEGGIYTGLLNTSQGEIPLEEITIEDGNLRCTFEAAGYNMVMKGIFEGTSFEGNISVDYTEFPITATKRE